MCPAATVLGAACWVWRMLASEHALPKRLAVCCSILTLLWPQWHLYNGVCFLGEACQPGRVPAAELAQLSLRRFRALLDAAGSSGGSSSSSSSGSSAALQAWLAAGAQVGGAAGTYVAAAAATGAAAAAAAA